MTHKASIAVAMTVMLILSAALVGCIDQQITGQLLVDKTTLSDEDIRTYGLEMTMTQTLNGTDGGQDIATDITYRMSIDADKQHRKMHIVATNQSGQGTTESELIIIGNTLYIKGDNPINPNAWSEAGILEDAWESQDTVGQHYDLLRSTDFETVSSERVNDIDSLSINFTPTREQLINIASQYVPGELLSYAPDITTAIPHASVKHWYDEQTLLPVKSITELSITLNQQTLGIPAQINAEVDIRQEISIIYHHINGPVQIQAPQIPEPGDESIEIGDLFEQGDLHSTDLTEETLVAGVAATQTEMQTSRFKMLMNMQIVGEDYGEPMDTSMVAIISAAINMPEQKMQMQMSMRMPDEIQSAGTPDTIEMNMYLIENTLYMNLGESLGLPAQWMKTTIPEEELGEIWQSQDMASQMTDLLMDAYNIEIQGETTIDGIACYQASMEPDMAQLLDIMMQQNVNLVELENLGESLDMIQGFTLTQWYGVDTFLPVAMEASMNMQGEDEDGAGNINMQMSVLYSDWNEPLTITLPEEAADAIDMSDSMGISIDIDDVL